MDRPTPSRRYEIEHIVQRSADRALIEATDRATGRRCMLKLSPAGGWLEAEGGLLARLDHPNLVAWHDHLRGLSGFSDRPFSGFAAELVDGVAFNQLGGEVSDRLGRFLQLLSAVHYLHRCDTLHLDIKPDNVLVSEERVVLLDLGSARPLGSGPGEAGGTLGYAAPEILQGHAPSVASDMYSLGAVLYELLLTKNLFLTATPESQGTGADRQVHPTGIPWRRNTPPEFPVSWASLEAESCSGRHDDEITTEITEAGPLWLAAPGHQRFLDRQG